MATFSTSDALGAGFRVIGKRPLSVVVWGLVYLVVGVLPILGAFATIGPDVVGLIQEAAAAAKAGLDHEPSPDRFMAMHGRMMMFQPLFMLAALASQALVSAAIFRAVLEPANRGFFYLRLGAKELWVALTSVVLSILLALIALAILIAAGAVCAALIMGAKAAGAPEGVQALLAVLAVIAGIVAFTWVAVRFSLALPMTFADGQFRVFESWTLTRGHAGQLFVLGLVLIIILVVVGAIAQGIALGAVVGGGLAMADHLKDLEAFFRQPPEQIFAVIGPWLGLALILLCVVRAGLMAIFLAPWAEAFRELTAEKAA